MPCPALVSNETRRRAWTRCDRATLSAATVARLRPRRRKDRAAIIERCESKRGDTSATEVTYPVRAVYRADQRTAARPVRVLPEIRIDRDLRNKPNLVHRTRASDMSNESVKTVSASRLTCHSSVRKLISLLRRGRESCTIGEHWFAGYKLNSDLQVSYCNEKWSVILKSWVITRHLHVYGFCSG